MTIPTPPGQPQDPNQPGGYVPPQPPTDYGAAPQQQPSPPTSQFQQPGQPYPQPGPAGPPTGQYPQPPQTQSIQDKIKSMPPKQLGIIGGAAGGGLLLLIILIVVIANSGSSPSAVADDYMAALADADIEEAKEYMCDPSKAELGMSEAEFEEIVEDMDWEIIDEDIDADGNKATVEIKVTGNGDVAGDVKLKLEERDGDWFVCEESAF